MRRRGEPGRGVGHPDPDKSINDNTDVIDPNEQEQVIDMKKLWGTEKYNDFVAKGKLMEAAITPEERQRLDAEREAQRAVAKMNQQAAKTREQEADREFQKKQGWISEISKAIVADSPTAVRLLIENFLSSHDSRDAKTIEATLNDNLHEEHARRMDIRQPNGEHKSVDIVVNVPGKGGGLEQLRITASATHLETGNPTLYFKVGEPQLAKSRKLEGVSAMGSRKKAEPTSTQSESSGWSRALSTFKGWFKSKK